jgi:hypothetical protein
MKIGFHPVADNPVRMAYVPGWSSIERLLDRLDELQRQIGRGRVCPAPWEPFYAQWPCCRDAASCAAARDGLENPAAFPVHLALFPDVEHPTGTTISRANWQLLAIRTEPSRITRQLMCAESLALWETSAVDWLEQIVEQSARLGVDTSVEFLRQQVLGRLEPLKNWPPEEEAIDLRPDVQSASRGHGFDKDLLHLDDWTPDPGTIIVPVDAPARALAHELLLMNLRRVALFRGRKLTRSVAWEDVSIVYLFDGALTFDVRGEPPLAVPGFQHLEDVLKTVQQCFKTATERLLQAMATRVTRVTP